MPGSQAGSEEATETADTPSQWEGAGTGRGTRAWTTGATPATLRGDEGEGEIVSVCFYHLFFTFLYFDKCIGK